MVLRSVTLHDNTTRGALCRTTEYVNSAVGRRATGSGARQPERRPALGPGEPSGGDDAADSGRDDTSVADTGSVGIGSALVSPVLKLMCVTCTTPSLQVFYKSSIRSNDRGLIFL